MNDPRLTELGSEIRRDRLGHLLESRELDAAVITDVPDIYYFTGKLLPPDLPSLFLLDGEGSISAIAPEGHTVSSVDQGLYYPWNLEGIDHMLEVGADLLVGRGWKRVGVQRSALLNVVREAIASSSEVQLLSIDDDITDMQSRKDPDEVAVLRGSIKANLGAYAAVQEVIAPGITELDVLAAGIRRAMEAAGEKVFHDGDYQCGAYNGAARNRAIEAGELYIVDAWTCFRGYWADMSRTFVVGSDPTDPQLALFEHIRFVLQRIQELLRPGIDGRDVFYALDELVRQHPPLAEQGLIHHGGHAIGLRSHELPDINRDRGGLLESGNVICIEPGGYFPEARFGVRLENMYLITSDGCENLCPGELELHRCG
jgi:Xaa-Pro aminopeptidase